MHINELKAKSPQQLLKMAEDMGIENPAQLNVQQLRFAVMRVFAADKKVTLIGDGVLERMQDGFGFLRAPESNYLAGPDDLYVSPNLIKKYGLKTGDYIEGQIQAPAAETERYFALETIERVNGDSPEKLKHRVSFDDMTPLYPDEQLKMEVSDDSDKGRNLSAREFHVFSIILTEFGHHVLLNILVHKEIWLIKGKKTVFFFLHLLFTFVDGETEWRL